MTRTVTFATAALATLAMQAHATDPVNGMSTGSWTGPLPTGHSPLRSTLDRWYDRS